MPDFNLSRYSLGVERVRHRGVEVTTSVGNPAQDKIYTDSLSQYDNRVGSIPNGYEHRPDLISHVFYNTPGKWWLLMVVNGVTDPFEGFDPNDRILIPRL